MDLYRERIEGLSQGPCDATAAEEKLVREFRLVGVKAERATLTELALARQLGSEVARKLTRELDLAETRHRG